MKVVRSGGSFLIVSARSEADFLEGFGKRQKCPEVLFTGTADGIEFAIAVG
ncbi:hypothetical protein TRP66_11925 [Pseudomonas sp. JDS28PS106]